ncbi:MAG: M3 family oligoendopeptidase [Anaerolineales bacterium]|nr:M3 family oligoendopeptidase [Anaerolineales bacterium]MCB8937999.1 M3 family oligoendopeptidase [Ardenticatenaceae bacterium]
MSNVQSGLPHWDFSTVFPGLDSPQFETGYQQVIEAIASMVQLFDENGINRLETAVPVGDQLVSLFDTIINRFNEIDEQIHILQAYLYGYLTTDSRNTEAQARHSQLLPHLSRLSLLGTRLTAWIGSLDVEELLEKSAVAREHEYTLLQARERALHLMSPEQEDLAAELALTGGSSWYRLFNNFTSQITVNIERDGEMQKMPLTAAQNLAYDPDRAVRAQAHQAVLATLAEAAVPVAACLNSLKGETLALTQRRGWENPLDMVLFQNAIDRPTLDAMMNATRKSFPDFQRYLKARAKALGLPKMAWYDRLVPLGQGEQSWAYQDATEFVLTQFGTYSEKMRGLAERAFKENWIDAEPRDGKRGGAFCMGLRDEESRILTNFEPGFSGVSTLAHELGHAYHNMCLAQRTPLLRDTPMTLAETASTFCQKIVENAALATAVPQDQLIILDGLLEYAARVVLGASSNFMFEEKLFEKRKERELSVEELCALDEETQLASLGDALEDGSLHPYRWAYVPHYYGSTFYNFPYTFGLLFGLGLYAQYQAEPEPFKAGYDELLSMTGMGNAADLANRFGIDIRSEAFWEASLDVLRADIDKFVALVEATE